MSLLAHGIVGRTDLPIPEWLFGWAAAMVLVDLVRRAGGPVAPAAAAGRRSSGRCPGGVSRVLTSRAVERAVRGDRRRAAGAGGVDRPVGHPDAAGQLRADVRVRDLLAGLRAAGVLFGDVFRAFNPWRAIGRAVAWVAQRGGPRPDAGPDDVPGAAGPLAGGGGPVRLRDAGAGGVQRRQAGERGDRGARLLGARRSSAWPSTASRRGASAGRPSGSTSTCSRASPRSAARAMRSGSGARCPGWPRSSPSRERSRCWRF